jgi:hypothetical protein
LEGAGSALSRLQGRPIGPIDPFGFSWLVTVLLQRPQLMGVGFPWISLDSLVRIVTFQWVTRLGAGINFPPAFSLAFAAPGQDPLVLAYGNEGLFMGQGYPDF